MPSNITITQLIEKTAQYLEARDDGNTQEIIELLSLKGINDHGHSGLQLLVLNASQILKKLFVRSKTNDELRSAIINALPLQSDDHWNGLHVICRYAPDLFLELIEISKTDEYLTNVIAELIPVIEKNGCTVLHIIARYNLAQFGLFLEFAKAHANVMIGIAKSLTIQTEALAINGAHATPLELISEFGSTELAEEVMRSCEAVYPVSYEQCGKLISKIPQRKLIEKIILFVELDSGKKLSNAKKESYRDGVCVGLSIVESYMEAFQKMSWWDALTDQMMQWDGNKESLQSSILLPMADGVETLYSLFRRAVYYILYNHQKQLEFGNAADQFRFLREKRFFSEKGEIQTYEVAAGYFEDTDLNKLLHPNVFSQEAIYLIHGNFHCCTIRYT